MDYIRRVVDKELDQKTEAFNAVSIVGPKGCGKTRTARESFRMKKRGADTSLLRKQRQVCF